MAVINGKDVAMYVATEGGEYKEIAFSRSCDVNVTADIVEFTSFLSGRAKRTRPGRYSWTMSCDNLVASEDATAKMLLRALISGTRLMVMMSVEMGQELTSLRGFCHAQTFNSSASMDNAMNYNVSFVGDDELHVD